MALSFRRSLTYDSEGNMLHDKLQSEPTRNVIMIVERASTAAQSIKDFFDKVQRVKTSDEKPDAITISGVGLRLGGRSSCYHLWFFVRSGDIFAVDSTDRNVIFQLE